MTTFASSWVCHVRLHYACVVLATSNLTNRYYVPHFITLPKNVCDNTHIIHTNCKIRCQASLDSIRKGNSILLHTSRATGKFFFSYWQSCRPETSTYDIPRHVIQQGRWQQSGKVVHLHYIGDLTVNK